jgi:hypothetical protein
LQLASIVLSIVFASFGVGTYWSSVHEWPGIRDSLVIGLLAGYLAPVVRDILSKLQQSNR